MVKTRADDRSRIQVMDRIYSLRNYQEIGYILYSVSAPIRDFIDYHDLSQYEYAKDLELIKDLGLDYGMAIKTDKNIIYYEVIDKEAFENSYHGLMNFFVQYDFSGEFDDDILMSFEILEILFTAKGGVKIDDIAEGVGYSRSAIRKPIKIARNYVGSYGLKIKTSPHHGMRIIGEEYRKRRALSALYNWFAIDVISRTHTDWLSFLEGEGYRSVSTIVNEVFEKSGHHPLQNERRRFRYYLIVQNARIKDGHDIQGLDSFDKDLLRHIAHDEELYNVAKDIADTLSDRCGFGPYSDEEILSIRLALFLAGYEEEKLVSCVRDIYGSELDIALKALKEYLQDSFGIGDHEDEVYHKAIACELSSLLVKDKMHIAGEKGTRFGSRQLVVYEYPLIYQMSMDILDKLNTLFGSHFSFAQISYLMEMVAYQIFSLSCDFPKIKILVESRNSDYGAHLFKELFLKKIEKTIWIDKVEVTVIDHEKVAIDREYYKDNYDLILSDNKLFGNETFINYSNYLSDLGSLLYVCRDLCRYTLASNNGQIEVVDGDFKDEEAVLTHLRERYPKLSFSYHKGVMVIIVNDKEYDNLLRLGRFKKHFVKQGMKITRYILLVTGLDEDNIYFYNSLLYELTKEYIFFDSLCLSPTFEVVNEWLDQVLK